MKTNLKFRRNAIMLGLPLVMFGGQAFAGYESYYSDWASLDFYGNIVLNADINNNSGGGEGVFIRSNGGTAAAYLDVIANGTATLSASSQIYLNSPITSISGEATVGGTLGVTGATTLSNTTVTGTTSINSSGTASTSIGNATGTVSINGASNSMTAVGANTIAGASNSMTAAGANTITGTTNAITATTSNTMSATATNASNNITANAATGTNNINARFNNIGVAGVSTNVLGNSLTSTSVTSIGGNATSVVQNNSASSVVVDSEATTAAGMMVVNGGAAGMVVDAHGKITAGTTIQSSASLTVTNSLGNTHGLVVQEDKATFSGGNTSSSLTMDDNGATFSNSQTGEPIQVHGVNDGTASFDAVNVRQFASAIASVTAMANIPQVDQGKTYAYGIGVGNFMGRTALAAGVTYRFTKNGVFKASVSSAMNDSNSTTVGFGSAWSY